MRRDIHPVKSAKYLLQSRGALVEDIQLTSGLKFHWDLSHSVAVPLCPHDGFHR